MAGWIATKRLNLGPERGGYREYGEAVPEAETWSNAQAYESNGEIRRASDDEYKAALAKLKAKQAAEQRTFAAASVPATLMIDGTQIPITKAEIELKKAPGPVGDLLDAAASVIPQTTNALPTVIDLAPPSSVTAEPQTTVASVSKVKVVGETIAPQKQAQPKQKPPKPSK